MQIYGTIALRKAFYSSPDWFRARHKALVRDRFRCVHCDADLKPKGVSRVNHKKPLAQCNKQEATNLANLESVCASCHGRISARDDVNPFRGSSATGGSNDPNDDWFDY